MSHFPIPIPSGFMGMTIAGKKSPDEACIKYKAFYLWYSRECHISGLVSTSLSLAYNSLVSEPYRGTEK